MTETWRCQDGSIVPFSELSEDILNRAVRGLIKQAAFRASREGGTLYDYLGPRYEGLVLELVNRQKSAIMQVHVFYLLVAYCRDVEQKAKQGKLVPPVGRRSKI